MPDPGSSVDLHALREAAELGLAAGKNVDVHGLGCSMGAWFQKAQAIRLGPVDQGRLYWGQVLVLARPEGWVAHRLIARKRDGRLVTKADAFGFFDEPACRVEDVRGQVLGVFRQGQFYSCKSFPFLIRAFFSLLRGWRVRIFPSRRA